MMLSYRYICISTSSILTFRITIKLRERNLKLEDSVVFITTLCLIELYKPPHIVIDGNVSGGGCGRTLTLFAQVPAPHHSTPDNIPFDCMTDLWVSIFLYDC